MGGGCAKRRQSQEGVGPDTEAFKMLCEEVRELQSEHRQYLERSESSLYTCRAELSIATSEVEELRAAKEKGLEEMMELLRRRQNSSDLEMGAPALGLPQVQLPPGSPSPAGIDASEGRAREEAVQGRRDELQAEATTALDAAKKAASPKGKAKAQAKAPAKAPAVALAGRSPEDAKKTTIATGRGGRKKTAARVSASARRAKTDKMVGVTLVGDAPSPPRAVSPNPPKDLRPEKKSTIAAKALEKALETPKPSVEEVDALRKSYLALREEMDNLKAENDHEVAGLMEMNERLNNLVQQQDAETAPRDTFPAIHGASSPIFVTSGTQNFDNSFGGDASTSGAPPSSSNVPFSSVKSNTPAVIPMLHGGTKGAKAITESIDLHKKEPKTKGPHNVPAIKVPEQSLRGEPLQPALKGYVRQASQISANAPARSGSMLAAPQIVLPVPNHDEKHRVPSLFAGPTGDAQEFASMGKTLTGDVSIDIDLSNWQD
jgi:hypothetical protein